MISLISTFTSDPLLPPLRWLLAQLGLDREVTPAPYGQMFQQLLDPTSASARAEDAVVLIRLDDLVREQPQATQTLQTLAPLVDELGEALLQFAARRKRPTVWAVLPSEMAGVERAEAALVQRLQAPANLLHLTPSALAQAVDLREQRDPRSDELGHVPYTEAGYAGLALAVMRAVHAILVPAHKVLVLDCDNTLWGGVVGEDGVDGIVLSEPYLAVQRFAVEMQSKGVLVCLASKNIDSDVAAVFEQRSDMILKPEHIVSRRVNWSPKPANLASLAAELNLGADAFVFLDDNPVECGQMREAMPQVVTLLLPPAQQIPAFLDRLWVFDKPSVTDEDLRRTQMYRENRTRQEMEAAAGDIGAFIASLNLQIEQGAPDEAEWPRVSQLSERTNQFNFTTRRRSEGDMRGFAATPGQRVARVRVRDRFGDYGLVGVVLTRIQDSAIEVDSFLLSCRVLGRGVEHAMLRHVAELGAAQGLQWLDLELRHTPRNEPARAFVQSVAASWPQPPAEPDVTRYRIPIEDALKIAHRPGQDPDAVMAAARSGDKPSAKAAAAADRTGRWQRYQSLALEWGDGAGILSAWRQEQHAQRPIADSATPPATETERRLLALWQRLFNMDGLGVEDDYAELGGTSLMAARLFADIDREFGRRLRLTTILSAPTVRQLAERIEAADAPPEGSGLVSLRAVGPRTLFLVHDGDGETLLYRNLAERMPADLSVVGIEPLARADIPLAHDTIEAMAGHYLRQVRKVQPQGPYLLGGMCAGGVIAFEMARQLHAAGQRVEFVALMDAAAPQAERRAGYVNAERAERLRRMRADIDSAYGANPVKYAVMAAGFVRRALNAARWQAGHALGQALTRLKFRTLRRCLSQGRAWPVWLPRLSVREIYDTAESAYRPAPLQDGAVVLLLRAMQGEGADTPYRKLFVDGDLGWKRLASNLAVVDVPGGHSSMLQEPWVEAMAAHVARHCSRPIRARSRDMVSA